MNKKGFTLIELIMVIVVIGIVAMIAIQSVTKRISDSKDRAYNIQVNKIENAAKKYMLENNEDDEYHLNTLCIKLLTLQEKGYLEKGNIKNTKTNENFNLEQNFVEIKYNFDTNQYNYSFTDNCTPNIIKPASKTIIENNNNGLYETTDSYIFRGTNPNNYIRINNILWRIVSIDKKTMMLKVINLNTDVRQITEDGILKDLNNDFLTGNAYKDSEIYINTNSKWNSGIVNSLDTILSLKSMEKQSSIYNTIGLLTVSEYLDASIVKNCNNEKCVSYLTTGKKQWLLNNTNDKKTWYVNDNNYLVNEVQSNTQLYYAYPCLYLKINTIISGGTGTETDPYVLK